MTVTAVANRTEIIDELCDRVEWIFHLLQLRVAADDVTRARSTEALIEAHARLFERLTQTSRHELLRQRFGLTDTELQIVWLLAAVSIDARLRDTLLHQTRVPPVLTLDVLRRLIYGERPSPTAIQELSADGGLRRFALIERHDGQATDPESRWTWGLAPRLVAWLHGDERLDPSLDGIATMPDSIRPVHLLAVSESAIADTRKALHAQRSTVVVSGSVGLGRRTILVSVAAEVGLNVVCIDCQRLARTAELRTQLRALARECRLLGRLPILVGIDVLSADDASASRLDAIGRDFAALLETSVLATSATQRPATRWGRPTIVIELDRPSTQQRAQLWCDALGASESDAKPLARLYPLAPAIIYHAAAAARARAGDDTVHAPDVAAGIRAVLDDQLGQLARRIEVSQTWDDLVLPDDDLEVVVDLVSRVRESTVVYEDWGFGKKVGKGLGTTALFSGPPGTGKTMVAALIARDLGLELYQVDLARVVSKWIGESERNLARLFDAAEAGHAILLFDEADALFGKRTEVKSSNDRYANLETNYLLQRLESFSGVCVLTSNHETNIDPAFQRRLSLHLRFELPEAPERARLWRTVLATSAPVGRDVDFDRLADRYELSGGSIRNAALRAAFLAAATQSAITMKHLERAARVEYEGLGKIATS